MFDSFTACGERGIVEEVLPAIPFYPWFDVDGDNVHLVVVENAEKLQRRRLPVLVEV